MNDFPLNDIRLDLSPKLTLLFINIFLFFELLILGSFDRRLLLVNSNVINDYLLLLLSSLNYDLSMWSGQFEFILSLINPRGGVLIRVKQKLPLSLLLNSVDKLII